MDESFISIATYSMDSLQSVSVIPCSLLPVYKSACLSRDVLEKALKEISPIDSKDAHNLSKHIFLGKMLHKWIYNRFVKKREMNESSQDPDKSDDEKMRDVVKL